MSVSPATPADPIMVMTIEAEAVEQAIRPLLAGRGSAVQAGALAGLLATWIAGHRIRGDRAGTESLREDMLALHLKAVRQLVELYDLDAAASADAGDPRDA